MHPHLNWVETLVRQGCTHIWVLPATRYYSGLLPWAIQIRAENESESITVWMVDGSDRRERNTQAVYVVWAGALPPPPPRFITKSTREQGERWWSAEWSSPVRNRGTTASARGNTCQDMHANTRRAYRQHDTACMPMYTLWAHYQV